MAGKTGLAIAFLHDEFIHVPVELLASRRKSVDPARPRLARRAGRHGPAGAIMNTNLQSNLNTPNMSFTTPGTRQRDGGTYGGIVAYKLSRFDGECEIPGSRASG